jgi:hypothetical protein
LVKHASGDPYADVAVGVWSDEWSGSVTRSEGSGKYSLPLREVPLGKFLVAVVQWESCGQQGERRTAVTEHCEGAGASNAAVVEFTGP